MNNRDAASVAHEKMGEYEYRVSIEIIAWCDTDAEAEGIASRFHDLADSVPEVGEYESWVGRNHAQR